MKLVYQVDDEQWVEISEHVVNQAQHVRSQVRTARWLVPLTFVAIGVAYGVILQQWVFAAIFTLFGAGIFFLIPVRYRQHVRNRLAAMRREDNDPYRHAPKELIADDSGLTSKTVTTQSHLQWRAIRKMELTDKYLYLYVSAASAIGVPRDSVTEGDFDAFADFCSRHVPATIAEAV